MATIVVGTDGSATAEAALEQAIQLIVELATVPGREDEARVAVERAEERCLIAAALDVPVHVELVLRSTSPALAGA